MAASVPLDPEKEPAEESSTVDIAGYDHERMKNRVLLSYEEEKKLLRRVDWHLMLQCALIFLVKNVDANNVRCICSLFN
jgi:hypothetical protein